MFRRVINRSTQVIFRRFSSNQDPPPGFEKFFKKRKEPFGNTQKPSIPPDPKTGLNEEKKAKDPQEVSSQSDPKPTHEEKPKEERPKEEKIKDDHKKEDKKKKKFGDNKPDPQFNPLYLLAIPAIAYLLFDPGNISNTVTVNQFMEYVVQNKVKKITFHVPKSNNQGSLTHISVTGFDNKVICELKIPDMASFVNTLQVEQKRLGRRYEEFIELEYSDMSDYHPISPFQFFNGALNIFMLVLIIYLARSIFTGKGSNQGSGSGFRDIFNFNKSNFKVYGVDKKMNVTFKDVAGQGAAKKEITEFVEFLKNPEKFKKLGARMPRGALLVGPPGTGKTLLAKASAGEANVPFFSISGSEFVEMFVGVGASRVRELFKQAREKSPSIVFIDEIDAVGRKRDDSRFRNDERDTTLNQLLVEMDGFGTDTYVIVMAATNRQDTLDSALLRPGRFDRIVEVSLPDIEGRQEILKVHLNPIKLSSDFDKEECSRRVAALTPGFSGADLSQLCNEAAILAARSNKEFVERIDFEMASEKVMLGVESSKKLTPREKKIVSYHESGHAVSGWFLEGADPVIKVSILPRSKGALGFAQNMPKETPLYTKQEFLDKICMILGGRVSEQIFFGSVTNGASDDLKKATQLAQTIVETFGMSDKAGLVSYNVNDRFYSEGTKDILESEVRRIINDCMERTRQLLEEKRELIVKLAERLIEKEGVVHADLVEILGERPFDQSEEYKKFISEQK